jgi:hypothetical protein
MKQQESEVVYRMAIVTPFQSIYNSVCINRKEFLKSSEIPSIVTILLCAISSAGSKLYPF